MVVEPLSQGQRDRGRRGSIWTEPRWDVTSTLPTTMPFCLQIRLRTLATQVGAAWSRHRVCLRISRLWASRHPRRLSSKISVLDRTWIKSLLCLSPALRCCTIVKPQFSFPKNGNNINVHLTGLPWAFTDLTHVEGLLQCLPQRKLNMLVHFLFQLTHAYLVLMGWVLLFFPLDR